MKSNRKGPSGVLVALITAVATLGAAVIANPSILSYAGLHHDQASTANSQTREATDHAAASPQPAAATVMNDKPAVVPSTPPALAATTAAASTPSPHASVTFPVRKRVKFRQTLALLDGLEVTPMSGSGGGMPGEVKYEIELLCPVLGPSPIQFRVGGEPTDLTFKGEAYTLAVSSWNFSDDLITVVLNKVSRSGT